MYWNALERGGHFAAFEQPEAFVAELRAQSRHTWNRDYHPTAVLQYLRGGFRALGDLPVAGVGAVE